MRPKNRSSIPGSSTVFSKASSPALRSTRLPIQWAPGTLSLELKRYERKLENLLHLLMSGSIFTLSHKPSCHDQGHLRLCDY
jgi:hypothetical protein